MIWLYISGNLHLYHKNKKRERSLPKSFNIGKLNGELSVCIYFNFFCKLSHPRFSWGKPKNSKHLILAKQKYFRIALIWEIWKLIYDSLRGISTNY